jgi:hypothetical protein
MTRDEFNRLLDSELRRFTVRVSSADPEECRNAVDQYNSARSEVSDALGRYANCISNSRGGTTTVPANFRALNQLMMILNQQFRNMRVSASRRAAGRVRLAITGASSPVRVGAGRVITAFDSQMSPAESARGLTGPPFLDVLADPRRVEAKVSGPSGAAR